VVVPQCFFGKPSDPVANRCVGCVKHRP
jgi:hypothetical protein